MHLITKLDFSRQVVLLVLLCSNFESAFMTSPTDGDNLDTEFELYYLWQESEISEWHHNSRAVDRT
jgi:hypothetical protein